MASQIYFMKYVVLASRKWGKSNCFADLFVCFLFGTLVLFAFAHRGCFLLCSGSSCLSSEDLVSPVYSQESVPSFIRLKVYKVSHYVGLFFLFHQRNNKPKQPSNLNLSPISQVSFSHPLSRERKWVGRAVFWW